MWSPRWYAPQALDQQVGYFWYLLCISFWKNQSVIFGCTKQKWLSTCPPQVWHAWGGRLCLESYRKPQNLLRELFLPFVTEDPPHCSFCLGFLFIWLPFLILFHSDCLLCNQLGNSIEYIISGYTPCNTCIAKGPHGTAGETRGSSHKRKWWVTEVTSINRCA